MTTTATPDIIRATTAMLMAIGTAPDIIMCPDTAILHAGRTASRTASGKAGGIRTSPAGAARTAPRRASGGANAARKGDVKGKEVSVSGELGGRRTINKNKST